jgi:putative nucleotidyltransferase with HDIG domain
MAVADVMATRRVEAFSPRWALALGIVLTAVLALMMAPAFPGGGGLARGEGDTISPREVGAAVVASILAGAAVATHLALLRPRGLAGPWRPLLLAALVAAGAAMAKASLSLTLPDSDGLFLRYMVPMAAIPMLVTALLDTAAALMTVTILAALAGVAALQVDAVRVQGGTALGMEVAMVYLAGGMAGVLALQKADRLGRYIWAGLLVWAASLLALLAIWMLEEGRRGGDIPWMVATTFLGGALSTVATVGAMVVIGYVFGMLTPFQLMELAQSDHPLLRRLQELAPGTYHHSLLVSDLAERAAKAVGADPLLVRAGCLFHDVGKLVNPYYYVENQVRGENPHDSLPPEESARLIVQHVIAGLELARRYRLPPRVRAFIAEHHGTRLVTYFYRKAVAQGLEPEPDRFRYPGPKPRSKETAIAMLADSVEAVVRAAHDHSPEHMDELVDSVIRERVAEGQLDDCDLTLRDVKLIAEAFKATLRGVHHPRIQYPEPTEAELRLQRGPLGPQEP